MIIKSKSRKTNSFKQLLEYIVYDKGRVPDGKHPFIISHNVEGDTIPKWIQSFESNEKYRRRKQKNSNMVLHEIVSFHDRDTKHLTENKLFEFAQTYIEQRNPHGMYIVVPHVKDDHWHFHVCGSPLEYRSGKSLRMSQKQFKELKLTMQAFQKERFPELTHSVVKHGRNKEKRKRRSRAERNTRKRNKNKSIGLERN